MGYNLLSDSRMQQRFAHELQLTTDSILASSRLSYTDFCIWISLRSIDFKFNIVLHMLLNGMDFQKIYFTACRHAEELILYRLGMQL